MEKQRPVGTSECRREEIRSMGAQQGQVRVVTYPLSLPWSEKAIHFLRFCLAIGKSQDEPTEGCVKGFQGGSWP